MMDDPRALSITEQENPRSRDIASMSIADAVALIGTVLGVEVMIGAAAGNFHHEVRRSFNVAIRGESGTPTQVRGKA